MLNNLKYGFCAWILFFNLVQNTYGQDSASVRKMIFEAIQSKDTSSYEKMARSYFITVQNPYELSNIQFISQLLTPGKSQLFTELIKNQNTILEKSGISGLEAVKWRIFETCIAAFYSGKRSNGEWKNFIGQMENQFGQAGKEIAQRFYFTYLVEELKDITTFLNDIESYVIPNYKLIPANDINSYCWAIFQYSVKKEQLSQALNWMQSIVTTNNPLPEFLDTYANLLYKIGRKKEALMWEARAVSAAPDNQQLKVALEKMQKSVPTW